MNNHSIRMKPLIHLFFFYFKVVLASDDPYEDFSNAILSDLGPLITLFGEQVTKQYMSESSTWAEHIIFAMALLESLTAIVSAIRVAGPDWLRVIVGRGKESRGVVELELMSTTSEDVCELWNGSKIVRVMGRSHVSQIIYFPHLRKEPSFGYYTVKEAVDKKLLHRQGMCRPLQASFSPRFGGIELTS